MSLYNLQSETVITSPNVSYFLVKHSVFGFIYLVLFILKKPKDYFHPLQISYKKWKKKKSEEFTSISWTKS